MMSDAPLRAVLATLPVFPLLLLASPARAHLPHDVTTAVAVTAEGESTRVVAQYHYPPRPLLVISDDGGRSWSFVADPGLDQVLSSLHFATAEVLYAADAVGDAPLRSEDGGWTWEQTTSPDGSAVHCAVPVADFTVPRVFAGTDLGLALSEDDGESWVLLEGPGEAPVIDAAPSPAYPGDPFVAALSHSGQLWCSPDGGEDWSACGPEGGAVEVRAVSLSPSFDDDAQIWAGGAGGSAWLSRDRGASWEEHAPGGDWGTLGGSVQDLVARDTDAAAVVGNQLAAACSWDVGDGWELCDEGIPEPGVQQSDDWGHYRRIERSGIDGEAPLAIAAWEGVLLGAGDDAWQEGCFLLPDYVRALAFSPAYPEDPRLWLGSYGGGLLVTTDGGGRWSMAGEGAGGKFIQGMTVAPGFPDDPVMFLIANRQLLRSGDGGETFEHVDTLGLHHVHQIALAPEFAGSGAGFAVGTTETSSRWAVARTVDGGLSWEVVWESASADAPQVTGLALSPTFDDDWTLFGLQSGPSAVVRSTDGGASWEPLFEPLGSPRLAALFALNGDGEGVDLVAVSGDGEVWTGNDGSQEWLARGSPGGPVLWGSQVPDLADGSALLILSEDPSGLLLSADGGASWDPVATPFSSPVLVVAVPPSYPDDPTLIASTHRGTFFTCDHGASWSLLDRVLRLEEDACPLRYGGEGWEAGPGGWDGAAASSSVAGDHVELGLWGQAVRWLAVGGSSAGSADVYADGALVASIDLADAPGGGSSVVHEHVFADEGHHTLRIQVVGDGPVDVDAFEVDRRTLVHAQGRTFEAGPWCVDLAPPTEAPPAGDPHGCCGAACDQSSRTRFGGGAVGILVTFLLVRRRLRAVWPGHGCRTPSRRRGRRSAGHRRA